MRWLLLFFMVLNNAGNAQENQTQQDPTIACMRNLGSDIRFTSIANKLAVVELRDTTFAMLANESLPNKKEQKAIAAWVSVGGDMSHSMQSGFGTMATSTNT